MIKNQSNMVFNIFLHQYKPFVGGIEIYVENFSRVLVGLGYEVNIITSGSRNDKFFEGNGNLTIYRLKCIKIMDGRFPIPVSVEEIKEVYKRCFHQKATVTIVNTRFFLTSVLGLVLGKIGKSNLNVFDHGSGHLTYANDFVNILSHIYEHSITWFIKLLSPDFYGVSKACCTWLSHFGIKAKGVVHNGVSFESKSEISSFAPLIRKDKKIIFYAGRLIPEKGIIELIDAFIDFAKVKKDYVLVLAGTGSLEVDIKKISETNMRIYMLGKVVQKDVFYFLSRTEIFVNPSNYPEGLPTVLLEAGSHSLPVISTPNGGAKEIIFHGKTGLVIPKGNKKNIYNALMWMDKNRDESVKMGKRLHTKLREEFGWDTIVNNFLKKIL